MTTFKYVIIKYGYLVMHTIGTDGMYITFETNSTHFTATENMLTPNESRN